MEVRPLLLLFTPCFKMKKPDHFETVLVIVLALMIIYRINGASSLFIAAMIIGFAGLLIPGVAKMIHWMWMKVAQILGFVSGKVMLTVIFIFLLVPLAFLAKWFRKTIIQLKRGGLTYFRDRNHEYVSKDLENMW